MLRVLCPHCDRRFRTQTEAMGKTAVCSGCHQAFKIGTKLAPFEWEQTDLGEDSWVGVAPPEEKKELKHCINCEGPLEEGQITCPYCGMNQITGLIKRPKRRPTMGKDSIWSAIPLRLIVLAVIILGMVLSVYVGIRALSRSVEDTSDQLAAGSVVSSAANHLREGGDEYSLAERYSGQVTDDNLPYFVKSLSTDDIGKRRAARLLIGCGAVTKLDPIIALTEVEDTADDAILTFYVIGARRLVELSCHEDEQVRRSAGQALCLLFGIEADRKILGLLGRRGSVSGRIQWWNNICRPFPQAVGTFRLVVGETEAPFTIDIEQIGRTFYLQIGHREFRSLYSEQRTFVIPIDRWCMATGSAVDPQEVRKLLGGSVRLASPSGAGWEGTLHIKVKRMPTGPLPGFVPFKPTEPNQTVKMPVFVQ
ncbi:MAG: hypothetical protein ACYTBZ_24830 [Planctomycetota bacterium]